VSAAWARFLRRETNLAWALLRRRIKPRGPIRLLLRFDRSRHKIHALQ
jgi:hypothetical protein